MVRLLRSSGYIYIYISIQEVLMQRGVLGPSRCLRRAFAIAVRRCRQGAQNGSKRLKNAQKGAKRLKKALEKAVRACPVPPVRSKRLFEPASVPPVRSKWLSERAVRDRCSQKLVSVALRSEPLHSALLCSVHGLSLIHISEPTRH